MAPTIADGGAMGRSRDAGAASGGPGSAAVATRVGAPQIASLGDLTDEGRAAFAEARDRLAATGAEVVEIDITPLLDAGALLYGGAFVAERHAAVGAFVESHPEEVDPAVRQIIEAAAGDRKS